MSPEVAAAIWSGGFTILGTTATLIITSILNNKTLKNQYEYQSRTFIEQNRQQSEILEAEHKHQKELSIIQHSLDKRTEVVLEFRRLLEESLGIIEYFHTDKADYERRQILKAHYRNPPPLVRDDIIMESISVENLSNMYNHALKQIEPIEDKLIPLRVSCNLLSVYLDPVEELILLAIVRKVEHTSDLIINKLRIFKDKCDPTHSYALDLVHIGDPYKTSLKRLQEEVERVRTITKKYVYVDRLEK